MKTGAPNSQPLAGKKVVVTRALEQAGKLAEQLQALGAEIVEFPTIEIRPTEEPFQVGNLDGFHWIVFTSVNAVEYFADGLEAIGRSISEIAHASICAVGPATKESIESFGLDVKLVPEEFNSESIADAFLKSGIPEDAFPDLRVLLPRGDLARDGLPQSLRRLGAAVEELIVYRNAMPVVTEAEIHALIDSKPDWITFTSASTAKNFSRILGTRNLARLGGATTYASIGPMTTEAAREAGIGIAVEPGQHDIPGLVAAIINCPGRES